MTLSDDIKTVMVADTGTGKLAALLTGGIYTYQDVGELGFNARKTPSAFDANKILKPCALIHARAQTPDGQIADDGTQDYSYRQRVEIYLYDDANASKSTIEAAAARLLAVLAGKRLSYRPIFWAGTLYDERELPLNNALMIRVDFVQYGIA